MIPKSMSSTPIGDGDRFSEKIMRQPKAKKAKAGKAGVTARKAFAPKRRKNRAFALKNKPFVRKKSSPTIEIKRAYDEPGPDDGLRILIDRLWPRGMTKSKLKLDAWVKHLSPSNALRKWYQHDPKKFSEFRKRYVAELKAQGEGLAELRASVKGKPVTLLAATKELELSHATVLRELLA